MVNNPINLSLGSPLHWTSKSLLFRICHSTTFFLQDAFFLFFHPFTHKLNKYLRNPCSISWALHADQESHSWVGRTQYRIVGPNAKRHCSELLRISGWFSRALSRGSFWVQGPVWLYRLHAHKAVLTNSRARGANIIEEWCNRCHYGTYRTVGTWAKEQFSQSFTIGSLLSQNKKIKIKRHTLSN